MSKASRGEKGDVLGMVANRRKGLISPTESRTGGAGSRRSNHSQAPKLFLRGSAFDLNPPKPALLKAKAFLDKAPNDELFGIEQLSEQVNVAVTTLSLLSRDAALKPYRQKHRREILYGNPRAIATLRRAMALES